MNSSSSEHHRHQLNNASNPNHSHFIHRENQYLIRQYHNQQQPFELNKTTELALHYRTPTPPQYSLFQPQTIVPNFSNLPSDSPMVKQLFSNPSHDGGESGSESLRYHHHQGCEPGVEVGTCEHTTDQVVIMGRDDQTSLNDWTMLDRLVSDDSTTKGVRFEDANHQINQLSQRGEMNFWGFEK